MPQLEHAHAQTLLRLRQRAETLIDAQRDDEYLTLVGELQFDTELWAHVWAPSAALAAHRLGDAEAFDFLENAAEQGFNQPEMFDGQLEAAFGQHPRFAATFERIKANIPSVPLQVHEWPDPRPTWPISVYAASGEREALLRRLLPERSDSAWVTARQLTAWVSQLWQQANAHIDHGDAIDIIEAAQAGQRFDAREYAVVLAQGLNALGIPARRTGLRQRHHHFGVGKGYIVAEAWIDDLDRWVLLDAQHGAYWADAEGTPLSAIELQHLKHEGGRRPDLLRTLDGAPVPDADFWFTYFSSVDTTGFGWSPTGGMAAPVFQSTGLIQMPRMLHDSSLAYPSLSAVGVGFSGDRARPMVTIHTIHPHARGFYVEDSAGPAGQVPLTEPRFVLPMKPGRHEIDLFVVTSYGRSHASRLVYDVVD